MLPLRCFTGFTRSGDHSTYFFMMAIASMVTRESSHSWDLNREIPIIAHLEV